MRSVLVHLAAVVLLGAAAAAQAPGRGEVTDQRRQSGDAVPLAVVGDRSFTGAEVDARWKADAPRQYAEAQQTLHDGRRAALDALIDEYLLDRAAATKGLSREQFEEDEISRRATAVTDAEIAAFYLANRTQVNGRSLDEMRPLLREFLEEQHRTDARAALVAALRAAAPGLRILLDTPRYPIEADPADPADGPSTAPVTIVEFADFECPFCRQVAPILNRLRQTYGDRVRLVWKDLPLARIHPRAFLAAQAGRCAHDQRKFWVYHDRLFESERLDGAALKQYADEVGLDAVRFAACLDGGTHAGAVKEAMAVAAARGLSSTPTTFINGRMVSGARSYEAYAAIVEEELRARTEPAR